MNFTRLNYDPCTYKHTIRQSLGTGDYMLNTPSIECKACFAVDPTVRQTHFASAACKDKLLIDVDSELKSITRRDSRCPTEKYLPQPDSSCSLQAVSDCRSISTEDTRISNPPCTLRGTGWNRWEWLCQDPQDKALIPFDYQISNRIVVKDNHRPCIPTPLSEASLLPPAHFSDDVHVGQVCGTTAGDIPSTHWRRACEYEHYKV